MPNSPEPTPKVFISYAWKNQPIAKQLQRDLQRDGVEVFVDYERITGGESLPRRINAGLEWCDTLVLLWSADSAQSDWVSLEWENALQLKKRIIPCTLDATELPAVMRRLLYLNFATYEAGYVQLCRSLGVQPKLVAEKTPPEEKRETPPPKRKPVAETWRSKSKPAEPPPVLKTPAIIDDPKIDAKKAVALERRPLWTRRKLLTTTLGLIAIAAIALTWKLACQEPTKPISELVKKNDSLLNNNKQQPPTTSSQSAKLDSATNRLELALKKLEQPSNVQRSKSDQSERQSESMSLPRAVRRFRDKPAMLSVEQAKTMLQQNDFYCRDSNWSKEWSNPQGHGFANQYSKQQNHEIVFDLATGLMWEKSGSFIAMTYIDAEKYIYDLNAKRFAGYADWRLPTLEEAMSLVESTQNGYFMYIEPVFDFMISWIWTADKQSAGHAWRVFFSSGYCDYFDVSAESYVRAVRTVQ